MTRTPHRLRSIGIAAVGGVLGGLAGATVAMVVTELIKALLEVSGRQGTWFLLAAPLIGITISVGVLRLYRQGEALQTLPPEPDAAPPRRRRLLGRARGPADVTRADLTADVLATAGEEERFPWRLAPARAVAIIATVGLGAPMGTESPAAHLGVAAGACLGDRGRRWRRLARPAAVGGGAAGVATLMGIPLVGTAFILELGRRRDVPVTAERLAAALVGGLVGWAVNVTFALDLIRLNVPHVAPDDLVEALGTALLVGAVAGAITSLTGAAIYRARAWQASAIVRLVAGGAAVTAAACAVSLVATPSAAFGPGGGAAVWADSTTAAPLALAAVALARAAATVAAVAAGGCGGAFVPFLSIGDVGGRGVAAVFGLPGDLAGAAGAAGGIAGGYRLPITAIALVLGLGGAFTATLTCLATVAVATVAGLGAAAALRAVTERRAPAVGVRV